MSWTKEKPVFDKSKDYIILMANWSVRDKQFIYETVMLIHDSDEEFQYEIISDLTGNSLDETVESLKADLWHVVETPSFQQGIK